MEEALGLGKQLVETAARMSLRGGQGSRWDVVF